MKKIKIIFLFVILVFTFSSCQKCQDCTKQGSTGGLNGTMKVCSGDFESNQDYLDEISDLEANDYECY